MAGWWIRLSDKRAFEIYDHATDFATDPILAIEMGGYKIYEMIKELGLNPVGKKGEIRKKVVLMVMSGGYMRVREYGKAAISFEFTRYPYAAIGAIHKFGRERFGPHTNLYIARLNRNGKAIETIQMTWAEFNRIYTKSPAWFMLSTMEWIVFPDDDDDFEMDYSEVDVGEGLR